MQQRSHQIMRFLVVSLCCPWLARVGSEMSVNRVSTPVQASQGHTPVTNPPARTSDRFDRPGPTVGASSAEVLAIMHCFLTSMRAYSFQIPRGPVVETNVISSSLDLCFGTRACRLTIQTKPSGEDNTET